MGSDREEEYKSSLNREGQINGGDLIARTVKVKVKTPCLASYARGSSSIQMLTEGATIRLPSKTLKDLEVEYETVETKDH